jgi:DNA transformation protein
VFLEWALLAWRRSRDPQRSTDMSEFVQSLSEVFERFGRIVARRMFGGHGIYHDGRMFALVIRDTLYLKSDAGNVADFDRLQLPPFQFERDGKTMTMSYRQAPAELFEDRDEAAQWARLAWEAALRSGQKPKPAKKAAARKSAPAKKTASAKRKAPAHKASTR